VASQGSSTRWTVILGAAAGQPRERERFARRYGSVVRAYLGARWRGTALVSELDDATQEVFVDCFKEGGALARVDPEHPGGFRAFLYGVVRNVARRFEQRRARSREIGAPTNLDPASPEDGPSRVFERAWARAIMALAREIQETNARREGSDALRRIELLTLRFAEGKPMREIAAAWEMDRRKLQYEYQKARQEFETALHEAVRRHHPDAVAASESARLLELL
jgi:RNA polymerase sigma-70 factor (ECF subfamily)